MNILAERTSPSMLSGFQQRNAFFDRLFYDVDSLTPQEKKMLNPLVEGKSSIIVVSPSHSSQAITHFAGLDDFLSATNDEGKLLKDQIRIVALAGVGSSVIGTAALARNVADVYGIEVMGIVTGYGAADVIEEALGGWFFYGAIDQADHIMRETARFWQEMLTPKSPMKARGMQPQVSEEIKTMHHQKKYSDIETLIDILEEGHLPQLEMLIGHSKGSLLIDFAAEILTDSDSDLKQSYFDKLKLVTFGAVTDMPSQFQQVFQFLGSIDSFGGMNSRLDVDHHTVDGAWHHLNSRLPFHMPIKDVLKEYVSLS